MIRRIVDALLEWLASGNGRAERTRYDMGFMVGEPVDDDEEYADASDEVLFTEPDFEVSVTALPTGEWVRVAFAKRGYGLHYADGAVAARVYGGESSALARVWDRRGTLTFSRLCASVGEAMEACEERLAS